MDKIEIAGYSTAAVCVVATLAVFFLWIMPANAKIKEHLDQLTTTNTQLKKVKANWDELGKMPQPKSMKELDGMLDNVVVTDVVKQTLKNDRVFVANQSRALIKSVVSGHMVKPIEIKQDRYSEILKLRADLEALFTANKVPFPAEPKVLGLPDKGNVTITDLQYISTTLVKDVMTALFSSVTKVSLMHGVVENDSVSMLPAQIDAKVVSVQQFFYFDENAWTNKLKAAETEVDHIAHPGGAHATTGAPTADMTHPLPFKRTGFRVAFQTLPANVDAALASLENMDGYLVTVKRLEVYRASDAFFKLADFNGDKIPVPQPYTDGLVQVVADVELLGFSADPKADEVLGKMLYSER